VDGANDVGGPSITRVPRESLGERLRRARSAGDLVQIDPESKRPALAKREHVESRSVLGLRHRELKIEGVQFHPESIMTTEGKKLLANFLTL